VGSEASETFKTMIPLHTFGLPEDIGNLAVYLASDLESYVTGASLVVEDGRMRV
jgi:NAD(P)-dependent dehydrogenase (short-subunit alcohol dehydrogenase family)